jgi:hypothetical protein
MAGCEDIGQRVQAYPGLAGHRETTRRQQRADLVDGPGDRGAVDSVEEGQGGVRELEPQDHQSRDHPIREDQLMVRPAFGAQPFVASTFPKPRVLPRHPSRRQLRDERTESTPGDASAGTVRESRTGHGRGHNLPNSCGSLCVPAQALL